MSGGERQPSSFFFPNYDDPEVKGSYLQPVIITLMVLSGTITGLRIITRSWVLRSLGIDDWVILPALVTAFALSVLNIKSLDYGWGRHIWDIRQTEWVIIRQYMFACQLLFTYSVAFTKFSILIFYLRFCTTKRFRIAIWVTFGLLAAWTISMTGIIVFQCTPVSAFWKEIRLIDNRTGCLPNEVDLVLLHGILSVVLDLLVLLLPIPTVVRLSLPLKQKIGLIAMFSLGLIVCLAGGLRIANIRSVIVTLDASWYGYDLWIYTSTEAHVGIICASIPSLKPLLGLVFPRFANTYAVGSKARTASRPYQDDVEFGRSGRNSKGYPLGSVIESRVGSEETVFREDEWPAMPSNSYQLEGVVKTTEIQQVVVHRDMPFR
ncbi:hypothetical protein ABW19_dt0206463 [Dactylella cylindrospora]|nr:hypothetical protein ABW19_dt0206463 [Dactylella cylindrospora]